MFHLLHGLPNVVFPSSFPTDISWHIPRLTAAEYCVLRCIHDWGILYCTWRAGSIFFFRWSPSPCLGTWGISVWISLRAAAVYIAILWHVSGAVLTAGASPVCVWSCSTGDLGFPCAAVAGSTRFPKDGLARTPEMYLHVYVTCFKLQNTGSAFCICKYAFFLQVWIQATQILCWSCAHFWLVRSATVVTELRRLIALQQASGLFFVKLACINCWTLTDTEDEFRSDLHSGLV